MIWGETTEQNYARMTTPQLWFAWHPVVLDDSGRWVWLEYVLRWRRPYAHSGWNQEYSSFWSYALNEEKP